MHGCHSGGSQQLFTSEVITSLYKNAETEILRPLFSTMTFFGHIKSLEMAFKRKKSAKTYNLNLLKIGGICPLSHTCQLSKEGIACLIL